MVTTVEDLYREVLKREPDPEGLKNWTSVFGSSVNAKEYNQFLVAAQPELEYRNLSRPSYKEEPSVEKLKRQILSQGTTDKWGGEGFGSAEKNAEDMAKRLAESGITDIRQFGVREKVIPGEPQYNEQGNIDYVTADSVVKEYYNKETGEPVQASYDKAGGDVWSGTFAGKGSTSYGVQFTQDGLPVFYTTYGGSSNSLVNLIGDNKLLNIAANVAASYFGGPAGVAALQAAMGKDIGDIAKSAALSYVGGQVAGGVSSTQSIIDTLGQTGANIAGNMAGAIATGKDPLAALASAGLGQMAGEQIGLTGTTASVVGSSLVNGVIADLQGKDVSDAMIAGAVSGYFSGEKKIDELKKASDEDIAGGLIPEYGSNNAYDTFMQDAMTPEAKAAIEDQFGLGVSDADIAGGLDPTYGKNETYDTFMQDAMTPEAKAAIEDQFGLGDYQMTNDYGVNADYSLTGGVTFPKEGIDTTSNQFEGLQMPTSSNIDSMGGGQGLTLSTPDGVLSESGITGKDISFDLGSKDSFINQPAFDINGTDATEREGSLAKDNTSSDKSFSDALKTGLKTALVGGGAAAAVGAISGLGSRPTTPSLNFNEDDIYKDAPLKGYHMKKDETTGRYIPYIGDRALLAKGGFVSKRK